MKKTLIITVTAFLAISCSGEVKEGAVDLLTDEVVAESIAEVVSVTEEEIVDSVFLEEEQVEPLVVIEEQVKESVPAYKEMVTIEEGIVEVVTPEPVIVDHSMWDELLKKYVAVSGNVNYKGLKSEKNKLEKYITVLQNDLPQNSWGKNKKMAYWINVYNVFTVKLIVDNYPTASITKLEGGKPWDQKFISIAGETYSLGDVENNILRKMGDARIHFAINCASVSCPKLLNKAFTEANVQSLLAQQTKGFLSNTSKNKITENAVQLSKIFEWYVVDFESYGGVLGFIGKYKTVSATATVSYLEYDWNLNE